jgi:hypothetical protein
MAKVTELQRKLPNMALRSAKNIASGEHMDDLHV